MEFLLPNEMLIAVIHEIIEAMSSYLCHLLPAFDMFNYVLVSVLNGDVDLFLMTVSVMTQQSLALSQMEVLPFCKHLCQWGHHIIFCSVPIRRCYIQDLFTVYLYSPVNWRYTWAHRKHTACNDVCPQQLSSTLHRDRHNMVDIHISKQISPHWDDVISWCYQVNILCNNHFVKVYIYNIYFCVIQLPPPVNIMIKHKFQ